MKVATASVIFILLASCLSCAVINKNQSTKLPSLYIKIGQQAALDKIVDNLINIIGRDDVVFSHFADSNITYFRKNLTLFLCHILDGPCEYSGDTMQDIHRGMNINKNQFNHFVELFIDAMEAAEIPYPIQNQVLARLAPLRENIIHI